MAKLGKSIADKAPPPDKLKRAMPEPDADEAGVASVQDEDDAAELSLASALQDAMKNGSAQDVLTAYKELRDGCKPGY